MASNDIPERISQSNSGAQAHGDARNAEVTHWLQGRHPADVPQPEGILKSPHGLIGEEHIAAERIDAEIKRIAKV